MDVDPEDSSMEADSRKSIQLEEETLEGSETANGSETAKGSETANEKKGRDINRFPQTRIRIIMKMDPDLTIASHESVYLITKAAVSLIL